MRNALACLLAVLVVSGCICDNPVDDPLSTVPGQCQTTQPVIEPQKLDILFVVDNSNSMREEQEAVARELTAFVDEVRKGGGVAQDFHVGVITTSVYQRCNECPESIRFRAYSDQEGRLQPVPDPSADGGVVLGTGTERMLRGDDPDLIDKFRRLVRVGTSGSGQETPFEAVRLALTPPLVDTPMAQGGNREFFRDRARLLVVVVTDEDDCSETPPRPPDVTVGGAPNRAYCSEQRELLTPVEEYRRIFLEDVKDGTGAGREIVWAAIAPVSVSTKEARQVSPTVIQNVDCPTSYEAGVRHRKMAELFDPTLANLDSICKASYRDTLINIAGLANISQVLEVSNVPDPRLLVITITRRDPDGDGPLQPEKVKCTLANGGLTRYDEPSGDQKARVHFGNQCLRRADDKQVDIELLCAG